MLQRDGLADVILPQSSIGINGRANHRVKRSQIIYEEEITDRGGIELFKKMKDMIS